MVHDHCGYKLVTVHDGPFSFTRRCIKCGRYITQRKRTTACTGCNCPITWADRRAGECTQCHTPIPKPSKPLKEVLQQCLQLSNSTKKPAL